MYRYITLYIKYKTLTKFFRHPQRVAASLSIIQLRNSGENWKAYLSERHLSVSILTDEINDAFMEEIGDTILEMEADIPVIIEDYREDIENLLGIQQ